MITALLGWWMGVGAATAASVDALRECLRRYDMPCAEEHLDALGLERSSDPMLLGLAAQVRFHQGSYPEAYDLLKQATDLGLEDEGELDLYQRTLFATAGWAELERGRFKIRFRPGMDEVLLEDALETLARCDRYLAPLLGGPPPGTTMLEIYPTERAFAAASSLMWSDVKTTGVVALSKWSRLLLASPRERGRGFNWTDTVAHEYVHLVVAYRGNGPEPVPVWLQEAIAKYLDGRWRDGQDHFALTVRQEALLAEALRKDSLVTFEQMHPSLAKLPTPELAALAYAQLSSLMDFCFRKGGEDVLLRVMASTRQGVDPRDALAAAVDYADFEVLLADWKAWISSQGLVERELAEPPVVLEGGTDLDRDPLLSRRADLADYVKLGELLRRHGELEAAVVEYQKAIPEDEPPSPILSNLLAQTWIELGRPQDAEQLLEESIADYPEFGLSHKTLGDIRRARGDLRKAIVDYEAALGINPMDPTIQDSLASLYEEVGDRAASARHREYHRILRRGGSDREWVAVHEREGELVVPDYDEEAARESHDAFRARWVGELAPSWMAVDLKGRDVDPADAKGKVVVLDFWATWCGPCISVAIPRLAELYAARRQAGVEVVGLTDEDDATVARFLARYDTDIPYTLGVDAEDVKDRYEVRSLPTAFVIDRGGRIREVVVGAGDALHERIVRAVDDALAAPQ